MQTDTTTKLLLAALAGALWVIALRPVMSTINARAATPNSSATLAIGERMTGVYVVQDGYVFRFKEDLGRPVAIGKLDPTLR
jgi:hypothetical protein